MMNSPKTAPSDRYVEEIAKDPFTVVFDIEGNGLLDTVTKVHCMAVTCMDGNSAVGVSGGFSAALKALKEAPFLVGHNIIGYDIPAIQKVLDPNWAPRGKIIDTLVLSKLAFPDLFQLDAAQQRIPKEHWGKHKLKAWGLRLGILKGDFEGPWEEWSQEMQDYCVQDVEVTKALLVYLGRRSLPEFPVSLEMELQQLISKVEDHGVLFDEQGAMQLYARLETEANKKLLEMQAAFPPIPAKCLGIYKNQEKRAEELLKAQGWTLADWEENREWLEEAGIKFRWTKAIEFNPNSTQQVASRMMALGWKPTDFTETGLPKVDESVVTQIALQYPQAAPLAEYITITTRLSQIRNPKTENGWLDHVTPEGRIHGRFNTMGCISFRFSHSSPNLGQVPRVGNPYGRECRSLFTVPKKKVLVGCDASGLELRFLGHYMAPWDGGAYAKVAAFGKKEDGSDIHTLNQKSAGLPTRDDAKTFIYALIYGAGATKLGRIAAPKCDDVNQLTSTGKKLKAKFFRNTPALKLLAEAVRVKAATKKTLKGLDGRVLHVRSVHSSLNLLLQSAGAIAVKVATVLFARKMAEAGYRWGDQWAMVLHVHDEWQTECDEEIADDVARLSIESIEEAGRVLELLVPLTGEAKIGRCWADTH